MAPPKKVTRSPSEKEVGSLSSPFRFDNTLCPLYFKSQKCVMIGGVVNVFILFCAFCAYQYFRTVPSEIVYTKVGAVVGTIGYSRDGNEFSQYLGIPYAKAERFEPPEPIEPWEGVRDASKLGPVCLQYESFATGFILGNESCNYLNIYVSKVGKKTGKAVLVYIHGGIFHVGGSDNAGPKFFMDEDIILCTINYRLGALGFLSTGDEVISGNMGLKDQNMALRWLKDNIEFFGGNPNKMTIFGESAGGASVHHHIISPASRGLIHKAIHQSGSSLNYWAVYRNVKKQVKRFAKKFNCPTDNSSVIASCLKRLDAVTLVGAHRELMDFYRPQVSTFVPTIEVPTAKSPFLTEEPGKILKEGRFARIQIMTGVDSNEGQLISKTIIANQTKLNEANDDWNTWASRTLHYPADLVNVSQKLRDFYFKGVEEINSTKLEQGYTDIFGDRLFIVKGAVAGRMESKYTPTYMYYYDYSGLHNTGELIANAQGNILPFWVSVVIFIAKKSILEFFNMVPKRTGHACHSDELAMLFNRAFVHTISRNHPDYPMSKDMVKLWVAFANDEPVLKFRNIEWKPNYATDDIKYLRITDEPAVISEPFEERRLFWESLGLPNL